MFNNLNSKKVAINVILLLMVGFLLTPNIANAVIMTGCEIPSERPTYKPIKINISLPGITEEIPDSDPPSYHVKNLQCFTIGIYTYLVGVIGILATVMIMYGGVKFLVSGGNPTRMSGAKDTIFSAAVGLVLVLGAYILLNLINPNLTELKVAGLKTVQATIFPTCTAQAIPDENADPNGCGDKGTEPRTPSQKSGVRCRYMYCPTDGEICAKKNLDDGEDADYDCVDMATSCTRITDDSGNTQQDVKLCDQFSVPGKGICRWKDFGWYSMASADDKCLWFPVMNCEEGWTQVGCQKCLEPLQMNCHDSSGQSTLECLAGANEPFYANASTESVMYYPNNLYRICCNQTGTENYKCSHNYYNL